MGNWWEDDRERRLQYLRDWRAKNRDKVEARNLRWRDERRKRSGTDPNNLPPMVPGPRGGMLPRAGRPGKGPERDAEMAWVRGYRKQLRARISKAEMKRLLKIRAADLAEKVVNGDAIQRILENPDHPHFMRALEYLTDRGYGKVPTETKVEVTAPPVVVLPGKEHEEIPDVPYEILPPAEPAPE